MRNKYFLQLVTVVVTSCVFSDVVQSQQQYSTAANKLRAAINQQFYIPASGYYKEHAEKERNEKEVSYLWPLCALIQADREEQAFSGVKGLVDKTLAAVKKYYDPRPPKAGYASYPPPLGGGDRFMMTTSGSGLH